MSAADILANMSRGWNREPADIALGTERGGMAAALWQHKAEDVHEVWAEPDPHHHIIATAAKPLKRAETHVDGRLTHNGQMRSGTTTLVRANERPRGVIYGPHAVLHLYLPHALLETMLAESELSRGPSSIELVDPSGSFDGQIERIAREVLAEMRDGQPLSRLRIDALGQDLAIHMLRRWSNVAGRDTRRSGCPSSAGIDRRLTRAMDYLDARLSDDVGLTEVATVVALSAAHLTALFRRATGHPPHRWLMRRRVERACELLADPQQSVTEIAFSCGFASSQHLATVFRKHMGVTPTAYRRERMS